MSKEFYKVEFDPSYKGGDYTGTGNQVLIAAGLVESLGMDQAFEKTTGHLAVNIVHYSNEMFDVNGRPLSLTEIVLPEDKVLQVPEDLQVEAAPALDIQLPEEPQIEASVIEAVPQIAE